MRQVLPSRIPFWPRVLAVLVALLLSPMGALARDLPGQMIYPALDDDPIGAFESAPKQLVFHLLELPDDRRARLHRLSWWTFVGRSHAARVTLDYAGIEGDEEIRYGGGRAEVRWTSRIGSVEGRGFALDLAGNLPTGDEGLFPLSAKAPMIEARVRGSLLHAHGWRVWLGYWGRRVSPPSASVRRDPLTGFPSGSGFDLLVSGPLPGADLSLVGRVPTAGSIADAPWMEARLDLHVASDLRVRIGGLIATSPASLRPVDHGILFGVIWIPRSEPDVGVGD